MSDLRERLGEALHPIMRNAWGAQVTADAILPIIEAELQKRDKEIERLKQEVVSTSPWPERHQAIQERHAVSFKVLEAALNEANKFLEQTIEVLDHWIRQTHSTNDYRCPICDGVMDYPSEAHDPQCGYAMAKPLLDNLKALKKEGAE